MMFRKPITLAFTYVKSEHTYASREGRPAYRCFQRITLLHDVFDFRVDLVHKYLDGVEVRVLPWGSGTSNFLEDGWYEVLQK